MQFKEGDKVMVKNYCCGCKPDIIYTLHNGFSDGDQPNVLVAWNSSMSKDYSEGCSCQSNWILVNEPKDEPRDVEGNLIEVGDLVRHILAGETAIVCRIELAKGIIGFKIWCDHWRREGYLKYQDNEMAWAYPNDFKIITKNYSKVVSNKVSSDAPKNKKTISMKINNFMKKLLDKETKTLIKAGFLNGDLLLTPEGQEALDATIFETNKAELVKMAEEKIAEEKEN